MNKKEFIEKYGEEAHERHLKQSSAWHAADRKLNPKKYRVRHKNWREVNFAAIKAKRQEACRKGGKYYECGLIANQTGLRGERHKIRVNHGKQWRQYKHLIALDSQIHHQ
jgi:hypothetical protein